MRKDQVVNELRRSGQYVALVIGWLLTIFGLGYLLIWIKTILERR